jgi:hypothetical protein
MSKEKDNRINNIDEYYPKMNPDRDEKGNIIINLENNYKLDKNDSSERESEKSNYYPKGTKSDNINKLVNPFNNQSSFQDDELMAHIDKEAEIISDNINNKELNIFNKFDRLNEEEMSSLLKKKT